MALKDLADIYFRNLNPLATKIHDEINETRSSYGDIWDTLTEKEKEEIIDETLIKPDVVLKYALLDSLDFDLNNPPLRRNDLMSFFGREHGQKLVQDDNMTWRDEHSAPFLYQTKSQLNLCLNELKPPETSSPAPVLSELAMSHSKVVSELKNALKSHDVLKNSFKNSDPQDLDRVSSPTGFISKFMGNFKMKTDDKERLVSTSASQIVASSENSFKTNFRSPNTESKFDKDYRCSIIKSSSDLSEENRGLLSNVSQGSSGTDFHSCEDLTVKTESTETLAPSLPKTGFDFLDNW